MMCGNIKIHVEVPALLLFFAYMSANSVTTNFILYRTCYVSLGYNQSDCALLGQNYTNNATVALEKKVQPYASRILITILVIEAIVPPILCIFLGPWSDKYGRKPLLLFGLGGSTISLIVITIVSAIPFASPWFLVLFLVPMCLSGGFVALLTAMLCYITDVTSPENRGIRIGLFEAVMAIGTIIGTSTSSFILDANGYVVLFSLCSVFSFLAWLYTFLFLSESVPNAPSDGKYRNIFNTALVKEAITTILGKRENYDRTLSLTLVSVMLVAVFASFGENAVIFLYLRQQFQWTLQLFTLFSSISSVITILGAIVGVYVLHKLLHFQEAFVILLGFSSNLIGVLLQGFATTNQIIYVASASKCISGAISPMARSLLSKLVPAEDSGKMFSLLTSIETLSALTGSAVYTYIYNNTLILFPAAFCFISGGIYLLEVLSLMAILVMQRRHKKVPYESVNNDGLCE